MRSDPGISSIPFFNGSLPAGREPLGETVPENHEGALLWQPACGGYGRGHAGAYGHPGGAEGICPFAGGLGFWRPGETAAMGGDTICPGITGLSNYFVTGDGEDFFEVALDAMREAKKRKMPLEIGGL